MLCDLCKLKPAEIHVEKHNGQKSTHIEVCMDCAGIENLSPDNLNGETLQKLINGIESIQNPQTSSKCLTCGTDSVSFERSRKLGCPDCYTYLTENININSWQKVPHCKYIGRTPYKYPMKLDPVNDKTADLEELEKKLLICINEENYEKAATLRDHIKEMKKATS